MNGSLALAWAGGVLCGIAMAFVFWAYVGAPLKGDGCTGYLQMIPSLREGEPGETLIVTNCVRRLP